MTDTETMKAETAPLNGAIGRCIVVADRGFVWTAEAARFDADWAYLTGAQAVRRWGTTAGLNQLANEGPQPATKLDAKADLQVPRKALIAVIPSEAEKWAA